uniref:Uncharacterized protein n=1 Tax=Sphondylothamnion multifidum TaxID=193186 RepID=A0A4D6WYI2_9FLOR|nr:hypothetical protein [Sphondylothamnion multifidum]
MIQPKKLLLVDDDDDLRHFLSIFLVSEGFIVNFVDSVESALADVRHCKPDLIISDIMMKKLNGYDFIKILKKNKLYLDIPIIFLTAKGLTADRIRGYKLGCHAYITKPFDPEELLSIIHNIFNHISLLQVHHIKFVYISSVDTSVLNSFTKREKNILYFLIKGWMNKEIASYLNVGLRNVEKYVSRLLKKTNTRNRTELVQLIVGTPNILSLLEGE